MSDILEVLEGAEQGLHDWILLYAPELCDEADVAEARKRISENHGVLGYASMLGGKLRTAIEREREMEKVFEQMREALEECSSLIAIMHMRNGEMPEELWTPLGIPVKAKAIFEEAGNALAAAERVEKGENNAG